MCSTKLESGRLSLNYIWLEKRRIWIILEYFSWQVGDLRSQADAFVKRGHFDALEIQNQMDSIAAAFAKLEQKVSSQKEQLSINYKVTRLEKYLEKS